MVGKIAHAIDFSNVGVYNRDMIRVNIHLTNQQLEKLRQLASKTGLTVAEIIRRAVDIYLIETANKNVGGKQ